MPGLLPHLGYLAVFVGCFLEGETVLALAGVAAEHGYLSLPVVVATGALGGIVGDQTLFFVGRRYGNRIFARFPAIGEKAQ